MEHQITQDYLHCLREKYDYFHLNRIILEAECELIKADETVSDDARAGLREKLQVCRKEELWLKIQIMAAECSISRAKQRKETPPSEFSLPLPELLAS